MKVIGVTEFGGPDALAIHEVEEPHAGPGEVRIAVRAFAVSPTDTGVRAGGRDLSQAGEPPYVPGMDAAGVVDEVGEGVTGWQRGDEVMAIALPLQGHGGAYVQELVAPVDSIARIPEGTSLEEASTIPMNGLTAVQIFEKAGLSAGQTLLVTGAPGLLGTYVVQLAEEQGIVVIADSADKDRSLVESLGADHIVPRGDEFVAAVQEIAPHGVDAIADTALLHEQAVPLLREGGVFIGVRGWQGDGTPGVRFEQVMVFNEYHSQAKLDRLRPSRRGGRAHTAGVRGAPRGGARVCRGRAPAARSGWHPRQIRSDLVKRGARCGASPHRSWATRAINPLELARGGKTLTGITPSHATPPPPPLPHRSAGRHCESAGRQPSADGRPDPHPPVDAC